MVINFVFP